MIDISLTRASDESDASGGDKDDDVVVVVGRQSVYKDGALPRCRKLFCSVSEGRGSDEERETGMGSDDDDLDDVPISVSLQQRIPLAPPRMRHAGRFRIRGIVRARARARGRGRGRGIRRVTQQQGAAADREAGWMDDPTPLIPSPSLAPWTGKSCYCHDPA